MPNLPGSGEVHTPGRHHDPVAPMALFKLLVSAPRYIDRPGIIIRGRSGLMQLRRKRVLCVCSARNQFSDCAKATLHLG